MFLKFDHFSHSLWSSNSSHEPEKGGHIIHESYGSLLHYRLVTYQNIHFLGQKVQKRQCFKIWPLFTLHVVIKLWSWAWRRWSNESYGSLLHLRLVAVQNIHFLGQEAKIYVTFSFWPLSTMVIIWPSPSGVGFFCWRRLQVYVGFILLQHPSRWLLWHDG